MFKRSFQHWFEQWTPRWLRWILFIPIRFVMALLFIWIGIAFTFLSIPITFVHERYRERVFRQQLASKGRFLDEKRLASRLRNGDGTMIIEVGYSRANRIWWTGDDVASETGTRQSQRLGWGESELRKKEIDGYIRRNYIDQTFGSAILLSTKRENTLDATKLSRRYPKIKIMVVESETRNGS